MLLCSWVFSGKNTVLGCHFLLQGIFLTQGSNWSHLGLLPLAGGFFTTSTIWEAHWLEKGKRPNKRKISEVPMFCLRDYTVPLRQKNWIVTEISCYLSCWQQNTKNLGTEHRWSSWEKLSKVPTMSNIATVTFTPWNSPAGFTALAMIQVKFSNVHFCLWTFFAYPSNPHLFLAMSTHLPQHYSL